MGDSYFFKYKDDVSANHEDDGVYQVRTVSQLSTNLLWTVLIMFRFGEDLGLILTVNRLHDIISGTQTHTCILFTCNCKFQIYKTSAQTDMVLFRELPLF